jgi:osmotically-inducible protein OsmY
MRLTVLSAIAFAVAGNVTVAAAADKDGRVEERVEARLSHDARLKDDGVKVSVDNGVATLKGKVATEADRTRAERMAAKVAGVTRVENKIDVDTGTAKDRIEDHADKAKDRVDANAKAAKDRIENNADHAKDRIDANAKAAKANVEHSKEVQENPSPRRENEPSDTSITAKVKSQYQGVDAIKGSDINVDTDKDGVVTLKGTVPNETARARAVDIARNTKGVHRVVDQLVEKK